MSNEISEIDYLLSQIEISNSITEIDKLSSKMNLNSLNINRLQLRIHSNEENIKEIIGNNISNIIELFSMMKGFKEEMRKVKKNFDAIDSQVSVLKKKYIEPSEKLRQSMICHRNIENMFKIIDKMKIINSEVKVLKLYYEKENNILLDAERSFNSYLNLIRIINEVYNTSSSFSLSTSEMKEKDIKQSHYPSQSQVNFELDNIFLIKSDVEWFLDNKERLLNLFRNKFYDSIKNQDNKQMEKYFHFFDEMEILLDEVKSFSNKILKEVIIDTFYNGLIKGYVNTINQIDQVGDNILNIRKEIKTFFTLLSKWIYIFENLGSQLKTTFSKKSLASYEDVLNAEGLKGIYNLFLNKVQTSFIQIITKVIGNDILSNASNYLIKDCLFFYFCVKNISIKNRVCLSLSELKSIFQEKFVFIVNENLSRALSLVASMRKFSIDNIDNNCK